MSQEDLLHVLSENCVTRPMNAVVSLYSGYSKKEYAFDYTGYRKVMEWYADNYTRQDFQLAEVTKTSTQFMIAFKLEISDDNTNTDDFLGPLVKSIRSGLQSTLDIPADQLHTLQSFVSISECYAENRASYLDIRVQFPLVVVNRDYCREKIIPKIIATIQTIIAVRLSRTFASDLVDSIIRDYIDYPVSLFGSSSERNTAYHEVLCFDSEVKPVSDFLDLYCVNNHSAFDDKTPEIRNPTPIILSSIYCKQETEKLPEVDRNQKNRKSKESKSKSTSRSKSTSQCRSSSECAGLELENGFYTIDNFTHDCEVDDDDREKLSYTFLDMWEASRFVNWADFRSAGESLYDSFDAHERGLQVWIQYTRNAIDELDEIPKRFRDDIDALCSEEWCTFILGRKTIENLAWIASEDDPDLYDTWHRLWCKDAMELAISNLHYDVAVAFYRCFWMRFITTMQGKSVVWYEFTRGRLQEHQNAASIRLMLSNQFVRQFRVMLSDIANDNRDAGGDKARIGDGICANITCLVSNLKTRTFKNNVVLELADLYMNTHLPSLLDIDPDILGTPSGVLVCDDEKITFRKGRPQDYVTKSTGCSYRTDFTNDTKLVKEVDEWVEQTFHDPGIIDYGWRFVSSLLRGVRAKKIIGMTGAKSNNSKSSHEAAIEEFLGDYCGKMPDGKVNGRDGNSEGPSPIMASMKGLRVTFIDEPDPEKPISSKILKQMTSDTIYGRKLNENGGKFKPLMTTVIVSNNEPEFTEKGKAMKGRYVSIPFETIWDDKAPEDPEQQKKDRHYKQDMNSPNRIRKLAVAVFWRAVNYYAKFAKHGLSNPPAKIVEKTENYWKGRDTYYQFITESTIKDEAASLKVNTLYEEFKIWHRNVFPTKRTPDRAMFISEMQSQWGEPEEDTWKGYRIKKDQVAPTHDYFGMTDNMNFGSTAANFSTGAMPVIAF